MKSGDFYFGSRTRDSASRCLVINHSATGARYQIWYLAPVAEWLIIKHLFAESRVRLPIWYLAPVAGWSITKHLFAENRVRLPKWNLPDFVIEDVQAGRHCRPQECALGYLPVHHETVSRMEKSHSCWPSTANPTWGMGGRKTKDCSQTWSFGFKLRLGKHFSDKRGLPFYCLKIGFLEYLRISGEIRYPNPISKWTHRLQKEGNNLESSLYCACWGCYPRFSGGGSKLIKKVPMMERLLRRFSIVEHR